MGGSGWVNRIGCGSKTNNFKWVKNKLRDGLVDPYFLHNFFFKENNIYLPFEKSCNKLLDVKCITLNSPLISRINLVKLINTYSIILKL